MSESYIYGKASYNKIKQLSDVLESSKTGRWYLEIPEDEWYIPKRWYHSTMSNIERAIAWGDTHPDEVVAALFMDYLRANPVHNLATGSVNERAVAQGRVRIAQPDGINMMEAYPGDPKSKQYEKRRAAQVLEESREFGLVMEVHSMRNPLDEPTAVINPFKGVTREVLGFIAGWTSNIVIDTSAGMIHHLPRAFAAELAPKQLSQFPELRERLDSLINQASPDTAVPNVFRWFKYVASLNVAHLKPGTDLEKLVCTPGFTQLPSVIEPQRYEEWGVTEDELFAMNPPSRQPNLQGFIGELVTPIEIPDPASWPI